MTRIFTECLKAKTNLTDTETGELYIVKGKCYDVDINNDGTISIHTDIYNARKEIIISYLLDDIYNLFCKGVHASNERLALGGYHMYRNFTTYNSIYSAYSKCSDRKIRAWAYCKAWANKVGGSGLRVVCRNCTKFSVGFSLSMCGSEYFVYHTADRTGICKI